MCRNCQAKHEFSGPASKRLLHTYSVRCAIIRDVLHLHKPKMWDSSQGMHKPKAESGHAQTKDREAGRKASLTKDKGMCYHSSSRRLAQTKDVGFISGRAQTKGRVRACTNPRQREAGRKASLTKVKGMCYHSRRLALTKEVGFIRACTNQRQSQGMQPFVFHHTELGGLVGTRRY